MTNTNISTDKVRPLVEFLKMLYGSIPQVAEATGLAPRTLTKVMQDVNDQFVTREVALRIREAAYRPPGKKTGYVRWTAQYVPTAKVQPLILYLLDIYETMGGVSEITDIPLSTLENIHGGKNLGVLRPTATKLVNIVAVHKRANVSSPLDGMFEGDSRRLPLGADKKLVKRLSQWGPTGVSKRVG